VKRGFCSCGLFGQSASPQETKQLLLIRLAKGPNCNWGDGVDGRGYWGAGFQGGRVRMLSVQSGDSLIGLATSTACPLLDHWR